MAQDRNRFRKTYSFFKPPAVFASGGGGGGGGGGCCTPEFWFSTTADAIFTTGSVLIRGGESVDAAEDFGTDNFFYVSGSIGAAGPERHVSVFGGDVVVSGSLTAFNGLSGSLTHLADGTSYLVAGNGISISSASNGAVTVSALVAGGDVYTNSFTNASLSSGLLTVNHNLNAQYVNVSVYDNNDNLILPDEIIATSVGTTTLDLTSYGVIAGTWHVFIASGQSPFQEQYFFSTSNESIFTTGSAAFRGQEPIDSPAAKGRDAFFYVSGSIGSKDSLDRGVAIFGGDVVISGSLHGGSPLIVSGGLDSQYYAGSVETKTMVAGGTDKASLSTHLTNVISPVGPASTLQLDDGLIPGQMKYFIGQDITGDVNVTPATTLGFTYYRITANSNCAFLMWDGKEWVIISTRGGVVV